MILTRLLLLLSLFFFFLRLCFFLLHLLLLCLLLRLGLLLLVGCLAGGVLRAVPSAVGCFVFWRGLSCCSGDRCVWWRGPLDSACWLEHSCYRCSAAVGLWVRPTAVGCFGCRADRSG